MVEYRRCLCLESKNQTWPTCCVLKFQILIVSFTLRKTISRSWKGIWNWNLSYCLVSDKFSIIDSYKRHIRISSIDLYHSLLFPLHRLTFKYVIAANSAATTTRASSAIKSSFTRKPSRTSARFKNVIHPRQATGPRTSKKVKQCPVIFSSIAFSATTTGKKSVT